MLADRIHEAETELRYMQAQENQRKAAEAAFVVAQLYRMAGDIEASKVYAKQSMALFKRIKSTDTLEDAAPYYTVLAGIQLPNLIHEEVVQQTFPDYEL